MKNEMITLKLSDKEITLATHEVEGQQLYKAQDLLKGYGFDVLKSQDTVKNWKNSMESKQVDFTCYSLKGKNGGTYLTKRQILKLAGYVSYEFEDAVYEAFEHLMSGDTESALEASLSVAVVHKVMLQERPTTKLKRMYIESGLQIDDFVIRILKNSTWNTKADVENRKKLANALLNVVEDIQVDFKDIGNQAIRIINAQNEINKYRAKKFAQTANYKKTIARKANRKLTRKAEALEMLIEETELELENLHIRARKIGEHAVANRDAKNQYELMVDELERRIEGYVAELAKEEEKIPF